eukprot:PRCOL_00002390-RA
MASRSATGSASRGEERGSSLAAAAVVALTARPATPRAATAAAACAAAAATCRSACAAARRRGRRATAAATAGAGKKRPARGLVAAGALLLAVAPGLLGLSALPAARAEEAPTRELLKNCGGCAFYRSEDAGAGAFDLASSSYGLLVREGDCADDCEFLTLAAGGGGSGLAGGLRALPPAPFAGMASLETLWVTGHNLSAAGLPENMLEGLPSLKNLHLGLNQLAEVPAGLLKPVCGTLQSIVLSLNLLSTLPAGFFDGCGELKYLFAAQNGIESLPAGMLLDLTSLIFMDLSGNSGELCLAPGDVPPSLKLTFGAVGPAPPPANPQPTLPVARPFPAGWVVLYDGGYGDGVSDGSNCNNVYEEPAAGLPAALGGSEVSGIRAGFQAQCVMSVARDAPLPSGTVSMWLRPQAQQQAAAAYDFGALALSAVSWDGVNPTVQYAQAAVPAAVATTLGAFPLAGGEWSHVSLNVTQAGANEIWVGSTDINAGAVTIDFDLVLFEPRDFAEDSGEPEEGDASDTADAEENSTPTDTCATSLDPDSALPASLAGEAPGSLDSAPAALAPGSGSGNGSGSGATSGGAISDSGGAGAGGGGDATQGRQGVRVQYAYQCTFALASASPLPAGVLRMWVRTGNADSGGGAGSSPAGDGADETGIGASWPSLEPLVASLAVSAVRFEPPHGATFLAAAPLTSAIVAIAPDSDAAQTPAQASARSDGWVQLALRVPVAGANEVWVGPDSTSGAPGVVDIDRVELELA